MDVIRTNFRFYDLYSLPFAQSPQDFSYGFPFLLVEYFPTVLWRECNTVLNHTQGQNYALCNRLSGRSRYNLRQYSL